VLFETAEIVPGLDLLAAACRREGVPLLLDAYHHLNVLPFDLNRSKLNDVFVTGGGYKYCQLGEGNCFLRVPPESRLRPVLTGWFAEFDALEYPSQKQVAYGKGAAAFGGATYDVTSHYRAAAVFAFHEQQGLTPDRLRAISQTQVGLLKTEFERLDVSPTVARVEPMPDERRGGFLAIRAASRKTSPIASASAASMPTREATSCEWDRRRICGTISCWMRFALLVNSRGSKTRESPMRCDGARVRCAKVQSGGAIVRRSRCKSPRVRRPLGRTCL
jgi:selenocysteine lyase/cysteine desulfurase